jgi:hypothetical protein
LESAHLLLRLLKTRTDPPHSNRKLLQARPLYKVLCAVASPCELLPANQTLRYVLSTFLTDVPKIVLATGKQSAIAAVLEAPQALSISRAVRTCLWLQLRLP